MDKFIVRFSAMLINLYVPVAFVFAMNGVDISVYDYWFSTSIMFGVVLSVLSHSQGKYHCKWMRGLCYNGISVPAIGYLDASCSLFGENMDFIITLAAIWGLGILYTLYEAINHFRKVKKVTKRRYGEIRPIECFRARKDR